MGADPTRIHSSRQSLQNVSTKVTELDLQSFLKIQEQRDRLDSINRQPLKFTVKIQLTLVHWLESQRLILLA